MDIKKATKLSEMQDAFNPNPLITKDEQEEFYLNTSYARTGDEYADFVQNITLQLEDSKEVVFHKLFIGHAGSGKTTELYRLVKNVREKKFLVCIGRCDIELDSADIEYTDVLFYILDLLVHQAKENNIQLEPEVMRGIYEYWTEDREIMQIISTEEELQKEGSFSGTVGWEKVLAIMAKIKGVIKNSSESRMQIRRKIEPTSSELIRRIGEVIETMKEQLEEKGMKRVPVVVLDGLDKIPLEQARKIFRENGSRFHMLSLHLIVTFPIALTYTPEYADIITWFPGPEKLPMIKIKKWENGNYVEEYTKGFETMEAIVEKRAELSLFEENVLKELIKNTGGYIRDLFRCISKAAVRARIRNSDTISMEDAKYALDNLESDLNGRYTDDLIVVMKRIYDGNKFMATSEEITKLLQIGAVLEYNGKKWCDLHPLVEKWLREHHMFN